ncbi:MAG: amino acid-binding protein [Desulfobacterales bacterium]|jgi:hypothetical protein
MKLKQISVPIENSYERLVELTSALGDKGITPDALTLVDTGNYGELRILVSDLAAARQILLQKDIPARIEDVVAVQIENAPGYLPRLMKKLMDAGIKIKYSYAHTGLNQGKTIMVFCFNDNDKAIRVLTEKQILPLDANIINRLEAAA